MSRLKKSQQDYFDTHNVDDLQEFGNQEAWQDSRNESPSETQLQVPNEEEYVDYTIEPEEDGSFKVVEHGVYEKGSVLEGRPKDSVVGFFDTVEDAQDEYPQAEIMEHKTSPRFTYNDAMKMPRPKDFEEGAAGETW